MTTFEAILYFGLWAAVWYLGFTLLHWVETMNIPRWRDRFLLSVMFAFVVGGAWYLTLDHYFEAVR